MRVGGSSLRWEFTQWMGRRCAPRSAISQQANFTTGSTEVGAGMADLADGKVTCVAARARRYAKSTKSNRCPHSGAARYSAGAGGSFTILGFPRHLRTPGRPTTHSQLPSLIPPKMRKAADETSARTSRTSYHLVPRTSGPDHARPFSASTGRMASRREGRYSCQSPTMP